MRRVMSFMARNFYNLKYMALVLAFCINFLLLFYKVRQHKRLGSKSHSFGNKHGIYRMKKQKKGIVELFLIQNFVFCFMF
jgi:hypothetical protein